MTRTDALQGAEKASVPVVRGDASDFDFFVGSWNIRMRRRRAILCGNDGWYDVRATVTMRKLPGLGNVDDFHMTTESGEVEALTLRLFDPAARQWSIYWASSAKGVLEPPVVGGFDDGDDGVFYGLDTYDGKPILVRFSWRKGEMPYWEQAFSTDGGETWETNWTMEFDRATLP